MGQNIVPSCYAALLPRALLGTLTHLSRMMIQLLPQLL